jgi:hypothetical protein
MPTIEQRLAEAEAKIEALEGHQDQITPGAYSLNSKGQVEEKLQGLLEAAGIIFPASTEPGPAASIIWENKGTTTGSILSWLSGGVAALRMFSEGAWGKATLESFQEPGEGRLTASVNGDRVTLLNQLGESSFPRLDGALRKIRLAFGLATIIYPGGSSNSNPTTINAFKEAENAALYFAQPVDGEPAFGVIQNALADSFELNLHCFEAVPPAGTKRLCYWLAILID